MFLSFHHSLGWCCSRCPPPAKQVVRTRLQKPREAPQRPESGDTCLTSMEVNEIGWTCHYSMNRILIFSTSRKLGTRTAAGTATARRLASSQGGFRGLSAVSALHRTGPTVHRFD